MKTEYDVRGLREARHYAFEFCARMWQSPDERGIKTWRPIGRPARFNDIADSVKQSFSRQTERDIARFHVSGDEGATAGERREYEYIESLDYPRLLNNTDDSPPETDDTPSTNTEGDIALSSKQRAFIAQYEGPPSRQEIATALREWTDERIESGDFNIGPPIEQTIDS